MADIVDASNSMALNYLSNKRVLLSSIGDKLDLSYYSDKTSQTALIESTKICGRYSTSLSSTAFGSSSQVVIPNQSFLSNCYLYLRLPMPTLAGQCVNRAWGLSALSSISYQWGSSNVPQFTISAQSIFQILMGQCKTTEKMSEIFTLCGTPTNGPLSGAYGPFPDTDTGPYLEAMVLLPLPWSAACAGSKIPFDTTLLNDPITIIVNFANDTDLMWKNKTGIQSTYNPPNFTMAKIICVQADLTDKGLGLKNTMLANPNLIAAYPFIYHSSHQFTQIVGTTKDSGAQSQVNLTGFLNADLLGISFGVVRNNLLKTGADVATAQFAYDDLSNVRLEINGQVLYESTGEMYRSFNIIDSVGYCSVDNIYWNLSGDPNASGFSKPYQINPIYIDLSSHRSLCFEGTYFNTIRIPSQTLNLYFNTNSTQTYTLYATYHYNASDEVQAGVSNIILN